MVFFNCNTCGEALKKNQVEKHYMTKCRQCNVLSCVDCGKDFWGEEYKQHIKCISEEEKYSGKDWKPKANANKGEAKQEAWIQQVQAALDRSAVNPKLRNLLQQLKDYPNIPRKKAKFQNFLQNSMRIRDSHLVTEVWDILEQEAQAYAKQQTEKAEQAKTNGETKANDQSQTSENDSSPALASANSNDSEKKLSKRERKEERRKEKNKLEKKDKRKQSEDDDQENHTKRKRRRGDEGEEVGKEEAQQPKKKKKKHKKHGEDTEDADEQNHSNGQQEEERCDGTAEEQEVEEEEEHHKKAKFDWEVTIIEVLKAASDNELSVKKLKKKVLAEFNARGGDGKTKSEEKLWAKFEKKINKNPRLKVHKDKVKLKH